MRRLSVFILVLSVLYAGFCAVAPESFARSAQDESLALRVPDARKTSHSCHSESEPAPTSQVPLRDANCCSLTSVFAVSTWVAHDIEFAGVVSHFFVDDFAAYFPAARAVSIVATSVDSSVLPDLQILYARFVI